jgi:hypothetical protein
MTWFADWQEAVLSQQSAVLCFAVARWLFAPNVQAGGFPRSKPRRQAHRGSSSLFDVRLDGSIEIYFHQSGVYLRRLGSCA